MAKGKETDKVVIPPSDLERDMAEMAVWDKRMSRAAQWYGLPSYPIVYRMVTDKTMLDLISYGMAVPTDIPHWVHGKRAEQNRQNADNFHVFEAALNMNPAIVWLGDTNTMPMQVNVMAHAVYGHVSLFYLNFLGPAVDPDTALNRFAQYRHKVQKLIRDPRWGWQGVEYILDAAHALANYSGRIPPIEGKISDAELREQLENEAETLRERIAVEGQMSAHEEKKLLKKLQLVETQLKRHPIVPTDDILGYLIDRRNTPNMSDEARMLLDIVRDRAHYLQPVQRTKFMHEGWASYWEKKILQAPHVGLPFEFAFDLAKAWSMHDSQVATSFYLDPYAMGLRVWEYIDRKYGFDEGEFEIERPVLARDANGIMYETDKKETVKAVKRNHDKMFEIARWHEDGRFLTEFLNSELLEQINNEALGWVTRYMTRAMSFLRERGWGPQVIFDPLPTSLDDLMKICQIWLQESEMADMYHQEMGTPRFPIPPGLVQHMMQVIQIVKAYDQNKRMVQTRLVTRTGMHSVPNIYVEDDGRDTDHVLTLKHHYDPTYGQLKETECRDTLKYFRRIWGKPVRLYTMKQDVDRQGNPVGDPYPFEYFIEKDTVRERKVT